MIVVSARCACHIVGGLRTSGDNRYRAGVVAGRLADSRYAVGFTFAGLAASFARSAMAAVGGTVSRVGYHRAASVLR